MKKMFIVILFTATAALAQAQVAPPQPRTIQVQAFAEAEITPDEVYVQVELKEYDKKGAGKVDINLIKNNFLERMKKMGLTEKEITVQHYSGYDGNYWNWYRRNKNKTPDMKASISYLVKLSSVSQLDEVVKNLDDEATQNFFIQKISHSKLEALKADLKIQALRNAKEKAGSLAAAVGEQVGGVQQIMEPTETLYQPPMFRDYKMANMAEAAQSEEPALNVDFKKMKLRFEAPVVFLLK